MTSLDIHFSWISVVLSLNLNILSEGCKTMFFFPLYWEELEKESNTKGTINVMFLLLNVYNFIYI